MIRKLVLAGVLLTVLSSVSWAEDAISKVKAANKKFEAALLNGNVGELDKMLTPQFAWIHGTGTFMTREQLLKTSARGPRYASVESDEVKVAVYGDAAVLTERSKRQYPQATAPFLSRFTIVYVKQDEAWRVASMHSSQLQPNGEPLPLDRVMPPGSPSNGASAPAKKN